MVAAGLLAFSAASEAATGPPVASVPLPAISGTAAPGQTLTCSSGTWLNVDSQTSYSYAWQRNVTTTLSTGSNQYTVTSADVGQAITCTQTATNPATLGLGPWSATETSLPVTPVTLPVATVPLNTSPPSISGTAAPGQTLTCSSGAWADSPTGYAYTWQSNGTNISGQTTSTYTVASGDVGSAITCTVVASNAAGNSLPATSPPILVAVLPVPGAPTDSSPPTIQGTAIQGQIVSCSSGTWTNSPTGYAYTWQRAGANISGATASSYTLTAGDVSHAITCTVVASNAVGSSAPAVSQPVVPSASSGGSGGGSGGGGSGGGSGGGGTGIPAPRLTSLKVVPGKVTVLHNGKRQSTKGAAFQFVLDRPAAVILYVQQRLPGRRSGNSCVAPGTVPPKTQRQWADARRAFARAKSAFARLRHPSVADRSRLAHAKRRFTAAQRAYQQAVRKAKGIPCARWQTRSVLSVKNAKAGSNRVAYSARVGRRIIQPATYRVAAAAANAGGWSNVRLAQFTVVPQRSKPKRPIRHH